MIENKRNINKNLYLVNVIIRKTSLQSKMFGLVYTGSQLNTYGGMPEWLIGAVLKTVVRASVPRVRIPIPPPF